MQSAVIYSICFSFGILFQAYFFLRSEFKKEDFKELAKDIGGGLFAILIYWLILIKFSRESETNINLSWSFLLMIYVFFAGFGAAFTRSFRKRILLQINQASLLILNTIFLYYLITRLGYTHFSVVFFYILTVISLFLLARKTSLNESSKGFLCIWYLILLISSGLINAYYITLNSISNSFSVYLSAFLVGAILFYIYCLIIYLVAFIPITENDKREIAQRREQGKEHFLLLISFFQRIDINTPLIFLSSLLLLILLLVNFHKKYIPENLFIALGISFTIYLSRKFTKRIILSSNDSIIKKLLK